MSSQSSCTKFMSERRGSTRSRVSWLKETLAQGSHAQWQGYARQESGCLKGNARPLSIAATFTSGGFTRDQSWGRERRQEGELRLEVSFCHLAIACNLPISDNYVNVMHSAFYKYNSSSNKLVLSHHGLVFSFRDLVIIM